MGVIVKGIKMRRHGRKGKEQAYEFQGGVKGTQSTDNMLGKVYHSNTFLFLYFYFLKYIFTFSVKPFKDI